MLQFKSFPITDAEGMNKLLTQYRLADKANIFIANGYVCIPIEDGEPENDAQHLIRVKEERNGMSLQIDLLEHSQSVMEFQIAGLKKQMERNFTDEMARNTSREFRAEKEAREKEDKRLKNVLASYENIINTNIAELTRLQANIAIFNETINSLTK